MTDPAIEAAERATQPRGIPWAVGPGRYALHGAREALAPIRDLHRPDDGHNPECHCGIPANARRSCAECGQEWPCATAEVAYTTDELKETR